jgi:hypothetical protein
MQIIQSQARQPNFVRAMFEDGLSAFEMPSDTTLGELAGRLARLAKRHRGKPISFSVRFGSLHH